MGNIVKFPLKMHVGVNCIPIVSIGDVVKRGQCIAEPNGLGAKIHSSFNGKVVSIKDDEIIIEKDNVQSADYVKIDHCENIIDYIFEAGIVGAGGAGFPTYLKLKSKLDDGFIIANCVECEPVLNHNVRLLMEKGNEIVKGIKYAMEITKAKKSYICIKEKNKDAINIIEKIILNEKNIEVKKVKDIYPMGEERALIHEILGIWLEPNQLPIEANAVVLNVETLINIKRAIEDRKPVIDKDITLGGKLKKCNNKVFFNVPIGTEIKDLIEECGGINGDYGELIIGGPYTGKSERLDKAIVTKTSGGAIVTIELPEFNDNLGLLVCACGANEERLKDIANKMNSNIVSILYCKNVVKVNGSNKCKTPGNCPGQASVALQFKKDGAKRILISNCSDCSNTVMNCAPKLGLGVYHHTDHVFRTIGRKLTRRLEVE